MVNLLVLSNIKRRGRFCYRSGAARVLTLAFLCLLPILAKAANFTASLDRDTITLGEDVHFILTIKGGDFKNLPALPSLPNTGIQGPMRGNSFSMVNGVASSSSSLTYVLTPTQPGQIDIPPITVDVDGQKLQSAPLKLKIEKAAVNPAVAKGIFVKLALPKNQVYLGELLPVEIQLYLQQQARLAEMPHFKEEGFTLGKMQQPTQASTILNNQRYQVITFKTFVVPAKAGKVAIGPASIALNVPRPDSRRTIFGELVDWQQVTIESDPQTLDVLPLPKETMPASFSGAVGNYSVSVNVSPTNVATGDPITVKVQVSGRGPLDLVTLPQQADWNQFKVYPPTSEVQFADELGMSGVKTFALTVVPESTSIKELPPFSFSYFDPDQKDYRTVTQPAVALTVRPSAASPTLPNVANAGAATEGNQPPAKDILHIKPRLGTIAQIQSPLVQQPWFLALQGVPVFAWISSFVVRKQKDKLANNPRLRRQRQVEQILRKGMEELRQSAQANQAEDFYATVFRLLQEQIGERLDLPASAITESVVEERLRPRNVSEDTLNLTRDLFLACNQARYARQSSNEQLISLIPTVEKTLNQLRNIQA
jgi:BatD DUF11 like domain